MRQAPARIAISALAVLAFVASQAGPARAEGGDQAIAWAAGCASMTLEIRTEEHGIHKGATRLHTQIDAQCSWVQVGSLTGLPVRGTRYLRMWSRPLTPEGIAAFCSPASIDHPFRIGFSVHDAPGDPGSQIGSEGDASARVANGVMSLRMFWNDTGGATYVGAGLLSGSSTCGVGSRWTGPVKIVDPNVNALLDQLPIGV